MRKRFTLSAAILSASLFAGVGCDKPAETPAAPGAAPSAMDATKTAAQGAVDTMSAEATKLLDQATAYVKDKKWDLAEDAVKKLEAMKDKLPAEWASKITSARSMLDTAKKGASMLPAGTP